MKRLEKQTYPYRNIALIVSRGGFVKPPNLLQAMKAFVPSGGLWRAFDFVVEALVTKGLSTGG